MRMREINIQQNERPIKLPGAVDVSDKSFANIANGFASSQAAV